MTVEEQIKEAIIANYKSVRAFTQAIEVPYSTIDSMLKKGIQGTGIQTVMKVCHALNIDIESIETGQIKEAPQKIEQETFGEDQIKLLAYYEMLNKKGKEAAMNSLESLTYNPKYTDEYEKEIVKTVPIAARNGENGKVLLTQKQIDKIDKLIHDKYPFIKKQNFEEKLNIFEKNLTNFKENE